MGDELTLVPLCPQQRAGRGPIFGSWTLAVERALKVLDCFLQLGRKTFYDKWIGFKDTHKLIGATLAIAKDGKGMRIIPQSLTIFVDIAHARVHRGKDG